MSAIKKILVPIDFSKSSDMARQYVTKFCEDDPTKEVTYVHVINEPSGNDPALEQRLAPYKENGNVLIKEGQLNTTLLSLQKEGGFDLIVMGTKGSKEEETTAATNASQLVLEADCPVLVVPEDHAHFTIKNIALALGKGEIDDTSALGVLHDIARSNDAKVHILTIESSDNESVPVGEDQNESILEYYLETLDYRHSFPKNSDIEEGINSYVQQKNIDLLAILPRNHAKKSKPSEGRLTKLLTLHAEVPILTID